MQKEALKKEIEQELAMRRKVWQTLYGQPDKFVSMDKQRRYDRLKTVGTIIDGLTQAEINKILLDAQAQQQNDNAKQPELF